MMQGSDNPAFVPDTNELKTRRKDRVAPALSSVAVVSTNNNLDDDVPELIDFDDVLPSVGEFGTYQIILFFLTAPFCFFLAFTYFSQMFITLVPDHWCSVPQLDNFNLTLHQRYLNTKLCSRAAHTNDDKWKRSKRTFHRCQLLLFLVNNKRNSLILFLDGKFLILFLETLGSSLYYY